MTDSGLHGVLAVNKPKGPTSAACVAAVKRIIGRQKIGHAGTLDPMAEGVLVVLLGRGTKLAPWLQAGKKIYRGGLEIGKSTDTYDAEGTVTEERSWEGVDAEALAREIRAWTELEEQEVPPYSAAKHKGKPLYALARKGEKTPVKTKPVEIFEAEVVDIDLPSAAFRVTVSPGVYIRSLVHSLGRRMGCGAFMTALTREYSRPFGIEAAHDLDALLAEPDTLAEKVVSLRDALVGTPRISLSEEQTAKAKTGMRLPVAVLPPAQTDRETREGDQVLYLDSRGDALAMCGARLVDGELVWAILRGLW